MLCYSDCTEFMFFLLTDCTWSLCFVTQIVPSLCFVAHRLYLEFIFCYSPIEPGVYALLLRLYRAYALLLRLYRVYDLLLTDCTWSLCFVTQIVPSLCFLTQIVPGVFV